MLKRLNAGAAVQAACAMELWRKADFQGERIVVDSLVRRRAAEKALFLTPAGDAWVPAPSPVLRPMIDLDAVDLVPLQRPVALEASVEGDQLVVRREGAPADDERPRAVPVAEDPMPAVTAAAEAVAGRLESLFADPGEEPDFIPEPAFQPAYEPEPQPEPATEPESAAPEPAVFLPPESEPTLDARMLESEGPVSDIDLDIPKTPFSHAMASSPAPQVTVEMAPFEFIPARGRPAPRRREPSLVWDLLLVLLGLAFFGFGVFWGVYAQGVSSVGFVTPLLVGWLAGLAGVGFATVAVFRLLQRLGRAAERD